MFSQKLRHVEDDELRIDIDPCYEADPYELKLDEMIDAEPEPEVIEGLPASDALTPADRYLELFTNVQKSRIFADSKTFPDCAPNHDPLDILRNYRKVKRQPDFDLRQFVEDNFWLPESQSDIYISDPSLTLKEHIDKLWPVLTREPQDHIPWSSLLALPQAYIVPGGRFSETYYWDSYFTMLGLAESGREDLLKCMADNFAWLIETYGHIPNGNRTYYLSRSQPPVFALMVELFEEDGVRGAKRYLDHLKMEHAFWMDGAESLIPHQASPRGRRRLQGALHGHHVARRHDQADDGRDPARGNADGSASARLRHGDHRRSARALRQHRLFVGVSEAPPREAPRPEGDRHVGDDRRGALRGALRGKRQARADPHDFGAHLPR